MTPTSTDDYETTAEEIELAAIMMVAAKKYCGWQEVAAE